LFLDEIGDMPLAMQSKLLRVLEEGEIERVGGDKPIPVDARVVVATHRNLEDLVRQERSARICFTAFMFSPLCLPPLRERTEEVPVLAEYFAAQVAAQNGWRKKHFSSEALEILKRHPWPGNVRELRNVVERVLSPFEHRNYHRRGSEFGFAGGSKWRPGACRGKRHAGTPHRIL